MKPGSRHALRYGVLAALTMPLLGTGACLTIAQQSVIRGFFNAVTPIIVDQAREQLGLEPTPTGTSGPESMGNSTGGD